MGFVVHLKRKQSIVDLVRILVLSLAGYLLISGLWQNLYWIITPRPPVLVDINWQGSTMKQLYTKYEKYRELPGTYHYRVALWRSYDGVGEFGHNADVRQSTIWYADPQHAKDAWQNTRETIIEEANYSYYRFLPGGDINFMLDQFYDMPFPYELSIPSSMQCYKYDNTTYNPTGRRTCIYLGYYEHWLTQIWFGEDEEYLDDETMFELVEKAVEILKSAPAP